MSLFACLTSFTTHGMTGNAATVDSSEASVSGAVYAHSITNMAPPDSLLMACEDASMHNVDNAACTAEALKWINVARAKEHLPPMVLPANFDTLPRDKRMLIMVNLERKARHLPQATESAKLDRVAERGAHAFTDPTVSGLSGGQSTWCGSKSPAECMFLWMYADGKGHGNLTCEKTGYCYGHRKTILGNYGKHPKFGTGYAAVPGKGDSTTQVFSD